MKFTEWLETNRLLPAHFAELIGVPTSTITRIVNGDNQPSLGLMERIAKATNGKVMPNDWISFQAKDAPRASGKKKAKK